MPRVRINSEPANEQIPKTQRATNARCHQSREADPESQDPRGRKMAEEKAPRAHWFHFGTCSMAKDTETKGVFGK